MAELALHDRLSLFLIKKKLTYHHDDKIHAFASKIYLKEYADLSRILVVDTEKKNSYRIFRYSTNKATKLNNGGTQKKTGRWNQFGTL